MANFRSEGRSEGRGESRGRSGGSRFGSRRPREFGGRDSGRKPFEMHDVICDKCKKECQVPFKPTGDKPVYCSDCFRSNSGRDEGPRGSFRSRDRDGASQSGPSGISQEQFKQINEKLDKILGVIETLELVDPDSEEDSDKDKESDDNSDKDSDK